MMFVFLIISSDYFIQGAAAVIGRGVESTGVFGWVTWTTQNGVNGPLFTAINGNSLFLPAAGIRRFDELNGAGFGGVYWSSLLIGYPYDAWYICSYWNGCNMGDTYRYYGLSVRAVRSTRQN